MSLFSMAGMASLRLRELHASGEAQRQGRKAVSKVNELQITLKMLEDNLAKSLMINEALWEIIRDKLGLTDAQLNEKLYTIDMRDGELDGKNQRSGAAECPKCHRMVSSRHPACLYCGEIIDSSVFDIT